MHIGRRINATLCGIILLLSVTALEGQVRLQLERADSLAQASEFKAAAQLLDQIISSRPRNFDLAQAYNQRSYVAMQLYEFDRAVTYNEKALIIYQRLQYEFIASNYMRFGTIELLRKNPKAAVDYFLQAKDLPHEDLAFSGILEGYLASAYLQLGKTKQAETYFENAAMILEEAAGVPRQDLVTLQYELGNFAMSRRRFDEAELAYQKALDIETQQATKGTNLRLAKIYNALGVLAWNFDDDDKKAKDYFRQVKQHSFGHRRTQALAEMNLALLDQQQGELKGATAAVNRCLDLLTPLSSEAPEDFIPLILDKKLYSQALHLKSQLLLEAYFEDPSEDRLMDIEESASLAIEVFESSLVIAATPTSQLDLLESEYNVYELALQIYLKLFESTEQQRYMWDAFRTAERGKAIGLKMQMQQLDAEVKSGVSSTTLDRLQALRQEMSYYETYLQEKYDDVNFRVELLRLRREYQSILSGLEQESPTYFSLRYYRPVLDLVTLQNALKSSDVLLSYYLGEEDYYIFVVERSNIWCYVQDMNAALLDSNTKWTSALNKAQNSGKGKLPLPDVGVYSKLSSQGGNTSLIPGIRSCIGAIKKSDKKRFTAQSHRLYRRLIQPVERSLRKKKQLIIIPHRELCFLPFETLLTKRVEGKKKYRQMKYLIKRYAIQYHLSVDLLLSQNNSTAPKENSFLGVAPVFNPEDSVGYIWNSADFQLDSLYQNAFVERSGGSSPRRFQRLEHSESEVVKIAEYFARKNLPGKAYLHGMASESALKDIIGDYRYVHIASHSFLNAQHPERSGIALAQKTSGEEDGILYAAEVYNLDLKGTELVVLSSCESARGQLVGHEGPLSLTRGFLYAGAENTLSSLWKVSDRHTAKLMTQFYEKLLGGRSFGESLRSAKLKMIKKKKTANPRLWAGFILNGNLE